MGLYVDQILPRAINLALRGGEFAGPRARVAAGLDGEVLAQLGCWRLGQVLADPVRPLTS